MNIANIRRALNALAVLTSAAALAQQNVDTVVTNGKILTVDADFRRRRSAGHRRRPSSWRAARARRSRAMRVPIRRSSTSPARRSSLASSTTTSTSRAPSSAGTIRLGSKASTRAAKRSRFSPPRRPACRPANGSWCRAAGRRGSSPMRRAGSRSRSSTASRRRIRCSCRRATASSTANSLALKAVGLDPAGGAKRNAVGLASFQAPAPLLDAMPPTSPAQLEQNLTDYLRELNATGLTGVYSLGQSQFLAARAAKGPLPVRLWETLGVQCDGPGLGRRRLRR